MTSGTVRGRCGCPGAAIAALPSRAALGFRQLRAQTQWGHSQKSQRDPREALGLCHPYLGVPRQLQFQIAPYRGRSPTGSLPRKAQGGEKAPVEVSVGRDYPAVAGISVAGVPDALGPPKTPSPLFVTHVDTESDGQRHSDRGGWQPGCGGWRFSLETVVHSELHIMFFKKQFN